MFSTVISGALLGIDSTLIRVETDISSGLPGLDMVGYLGSEVREAGKRVRVAMRNCGFQIPVSPLSRFYDYYFLISLPESPVHRNKNRIASVQIGDPVQINHP